MIGDYNRRITVRRWTTSQNDGGGLTAVEVENWTLWANIENRESSAVNTGKRFGGNGSSSDPQQQEQWANGFKVYVRYYPSKQIQNNDTIDYNGSRMLVNSVSTVNEGNAKTQVLFCTTTLDLS